MAEYSGTSTEVTAFTEYTSTMLGAPVINVELQEIHYKHSFNNAIEEYSNFINQWATSSHIANALGLPSEQDFTMRWVSQNFEFSKSFSKAYSEQANVGGDVPIRKAYFTLRNGKQVYYLPDDIQINEVLWQAPAAINRYLLDPNNSQPWVNYEFGWSYMGYSMRFVTPISYSIQLAQQTELRWRTLRGDYNYIIRPAESNTGRTSPDVTGRTRNAVYIYPEPSASDDGTQVWYFYKNNDDLNAYSGQASGSVISDPGTIPLDEIPYSSFNANGQRWVKQYGYATAKIILGRMRSKFSSVPIPDAEISLDGELLVSEGKEEQEALKERLTTDLEGMSVKQLIADEAENAENINATLSYNPMGIYVM